MTTSLDNVDPAMFNLVQSLFVDQAIDRADMIQILDSAVADGGVTATALQALEILTAPQNEARLNMPGYVAVLANDVVRATRPTPITRASRLGNLADQATDQLRATALDDLVGKWFYGTDLPAIAAGTLATYSVTAGPLFGDNPDPALDVPSSAGHGAGQPGRLLFDRRLGGDCRQLARGHRKHDHPQRRGERRRQLDRALLLSECVGAYVADYVTVNALLPGCNGSTVFEAAGADGSWWMPVIEKAYAQWNETGREGRDGQNAYESLTGGCMNLVDQQVLGSTAAVYYPGSDPTAEQAVIDALANNEAVTAAIFVNANTTLFSQLGLISDHAYEITGYDSDPNSPAFGTFQLENPWGFDEPAALTWGDMEAYCGWLAVADTTPSVAAQQTLAGKPGTVRSMVVAPSGASQATDRAPAFGCARKFTRRP